MGRQDALYWIVVAYVAGLALLFVGLPMLVAALVLKASFRPGLRRLARVLLAADGALLAFGVAAGSIPLLARLRQAYGTYSRTYHLTAPRVLAGVSFPAGSTVYLREDGSLARGHVPVPTVMAGLSFVGDFGAEDWEATYAGTLAIPAAVEGVPCQADRVWWQLRARVSCLLDRGYAFAGHDLAAGTPVAVSLLTTGQRILEAGTLARPELLFGLAWPAGTVFGSTSATATPERLAHGPAPDGERFDLCLMPGQIVPVPDAVPGAALHGTVTYSVKGGRRQVASGCTMPLAGPVVAPRYPDDGYAEMDGDRYVGGRREADDQPWRWSDGSPSEQAF